METTPGLVVVAEASRSVGLGHLMEALALRAAALRRGARVALAVNADAPRGPVPGDVEAEWLPALDAGTLRRVADRAAAGGARAAVVDLRRVTNEQVCALGEAGLAVVVIDELGGLHLDCHRVVNTSIVSAWHRYTSDRPGFQVLAGPGYLPLGERFGALAAGVRNHRGPVRRVAVSLGGADPSGTTCRALAALGGWREGTTAHLVIGPGFADPEGLARRAEGAGGVIPHRGLTDLAPLLAEADVALNAGGNTLYECACLGTPAVVLYEADHERRQGEAFAAAGFGRCLGSGREVTPAGLREAIAGFDDPAVRARHAAAGRRLVDGKGADRILDVVAAAVGALGGVRAG